MQPTALHPAVLLFKCTKLKKVMYQHDAVHQYEYYLWTKHYEGKSHCSLYIDKLLNDKLCPHDATDENQNEETPGLEK